MLQLTKYLATKQKQADKEVGSSFFIPYDCHYNNKTILTKKKELMQVVKVGGFSFETSDDDDVDIKKDMLNLLFKGFQTGGFLLYFHTIRRRAELSTKELAPMDPHIKIPQNFSDYVDQEWRNKYATKQAFVNELYISIIRRQETRGAAALESVMKKMQASADKKAWESEVRELYEELEEASGRVLSTLREYTPELLQVNVTENGAYCSILEFLGKIANCGIASPMLVPTLSIDKYLPNTRLFFGQKAIEARSADKSRVAGLISIKEYGPSTNAGMLDSLLQMPFELIVSQSFAFANRQLSLGKMQLQQNRMIQAGDMAVSQIAEINQALDMVVSGEIALGDHHLTILCIEDNLKALENVVSMASVELQNAGLQPAREKVNMEPAYWAQLPGNDDFIVRKSSINSLNLAGFASMHNYPTGQAHNNHWGDSVTVFDTTSGTPYHFNFHVRDVGHSLIIGPTGAGKTVLMNFLCAMSQKFKCRMFFFDKDRGAEIFIRALGGVYTVIDPAKQSNFNPFSLPDNGENRTFLLDLLKLLVTSNGETLSAENNISLSQAVDGNYKLDFKDRKLSNIVPFLGIEGAGSLATRISMWHTGGSHSTVFDNDTDILDFGNYHIFGFEMAELLKDTTSLGPVLLYIFHRINISLDGTATMIVLDEAWALIDNPVFAPRIKDWLKVLRKLNTFVIFATQSVEDASKSAISDTLIQQTATQIFLPNLKATQVYRTAFMLSQREYILIKTTDPGSRYFLIKQGVSAVIARIDLKGMTDIINVLSGRAETVVMLNELRKEHGDNPEDWLHLFYEKARAL
jgi:type IV secretion system protein VirB4